MALPSNPKINPQDAARRLDLAVYGVWTQANIVKNECVNLSVGLQDLVSARLQAIITHDEEIDELVALNGIASAYAVRFENKSFTFSTEIGALSAGLETFINFIDAQIPKNGVWLNILQFANPGTGNYKLAQRVVTNAGAIAPLESAVDDLLALIDVT